MRRYLILLLLLPFLALGVGLAVAAGSEDTTSGPVYTVAQVQALVSGRLATWAGRVVQVRGVLQGPFIFCAATRPCPPPTMGLVDDGNGIIGSRQFLPVQEAAGAGLRIFLRQLPLVGGLVPGPQHLRFGLRATYRLQLHPQPAAFCRMHPIIPCYKGIVSDVTLSP